jgi:hypothetical protein
MIQLMVQPSHLMSSGIVLSQFGDLYLFRFTNELQNRLENLLERKKADLLSEEEQTELACISELSRIFTLINAQLATKPTWCLNHSEDLYDNAPNTFVSTVIPPNISVPTASPLDHIVPQSLGGSDELENLALACHRCNERRYNFMTGTEPQTQTEVPLFNPRQQKWSTHFIWTADGIKILV